MVSWSCAVSADVSKEDPGEQSTGSSQGTRMVSPWCATARGASDVLAEQTIARKWYRHVVGVYQFWGEGYSYWHQLGRSHQSSWWCPWREALTDYTALEMGLGMGEFVHKLTRCVPRDLADTCQTV